MEAHAIKLLESIAARAIDCLHPDRVPESLRLESYARLHREYVHWQDFHKAPRPDPDRLRELIDGFREPMTPAQKDSEAAPVKPSVVVHINVDIGPGESVIAALDAVKAWTAGRWNDVTAERREPVEPPTNKAEPSLFERKAEELYAAANHLEGYTPRPTTPEAAADYDRRIAALRMEARKYRKAAQASRQPSNT